MSICERINSISTTSALGESIFNMPRFSLQIDVRNSMFVLILLAIVTGYTPCNAVVPQGTTETAFVSTRKCPSSAKTCYSSTKTKEKSLYHPNCMNIMIQSSTTAVSGTSKVMESNQEKQSTTFQSKTLRHKNKNKANPKNSTNKSQTREMSAISLQSLVNKVDSYCSQTSDLQLLPKAYAYAAKRSTTGRSSSITEKSEKHNNKLNDSISVAHILADMKLDVASIVTGLLIHSEAVVGTAKASINSGPSSSSYLEKEQQYVQDEFGSEILKLVQGITKIGKIQYDSSFSSSAFNQQQAENHRKMIVAMAKDIRVILVKLADQTYTLRKLKHSLSQQEIQHQQKEKTTAIANETLELYAPLAHRLGLYRIKTEMEDTSLQLLKPKEYQELESNVRAKQEQRQVYTDNVIHILKRQLQQGGMMVVTTKRKTFKEEEAPSSSSIQVTGRAKSFYSIYQKMQSQKLQFDDIQDLMAFRILVSDVAQCYQALGIVHSHWAPVQGRFKDYIALPKPNGYQSLHTTVTGPEGKRIEVQIRTRTMHRIAEGGIAAHWQYKQQSGSGGMSSKEGKGMVEDAKHFTWLRQLVDSVQQQSQSSQEVARTSSAVPKQDLLLFDSEVFCFSPQGQLFALPQGSSVLDFAYRIHSELGNHCVGAKVNGKMVSLRYTFQNGDTVEIVQNSNQHPQREWLDFCRTSKAKSRIKSWLSAQQRDESIILGKGILEKELKKYGSSFSSASYPEGTSSSTKEMYREKLERVLSAFSLRDEDHLLVALAYGQISVGSVMDEIFGKNSRIGDHTGLSRDEMGDKLVLQTIQEKSNAPSVKPSPKTDGIVVGGERNMLVNFCGNCSPLLGEEVKGVITRGRGIKVHRLGCSYLQASDKERIVNASWDVTAKTRPRSVQVEVIFEDAPGMLASMSGAIASASVNIANVVLKKLSGGRGLARFNVMIPSVDELNKVLRQLQQEQGVLSVTRR